MKAAVFNGYGISKSPIRWIGTENGKPPTPIWSTGCDVGQGDPNSQEWCSVGCDTTLQQGDHWFYEPTAGIRPMQELIELYHATVGNNGVLELDFAIDRSGRVHYTHAARYKEFGDWIRSCYGNPLGKTDGTGVEYIIEFTSSVVIDRVVIQEDQRHGQRVREYFVEYMGIESEDWLPFSNGTSIGNKRIDIHDGLIQYVIKMRLFISKYTDRPYLRMFSAYGPCSEL